MQIEAGDTFKKIVVLKELMVSALVNQILTINTFIWIALFLILSTVSMYIAKAIAVILVKKYPKKI